MLKPLTVSLITGNGSLYHLNKSVVLRLPHQTFSYRRSTSCVLPRVLRLCFSASYPKRESVVRLDGFPPERPSSKGVYGTNQMTTYGLPSSMKLRIFFSTENVIVLSIFPKTRTQALIIEKKRQMSFHRTSLFPSVNLPLLWQAGSSTWILLLNSRKR